VTPSPHHRGDLALPLLDKAERETVSQYVHRCLRHAVMIGRIPPGRSLTLREIAAALGVGVMPVREALRLVAAARALELRDNRRIQVPHMTAVRFRELCELRVTLEVHAALGALPFVDADRLAELRAIDAGIDRAHAAGDFEAAIALNHAFHRAIYAANPHQEALPLIESVWLQLGPFLRLALGNLAEAYRVDRHVEALAAFERRDPIALRVAIEADIRDGIAHAGSADRLDAYVEAAGRRPPAPPKIAPSGPPRDEARPCADAS
jgi:DNA-binding GntR family transcriptional regulator